MEGDYVVDSMRWEVVGRERERVCVWVVDVFLVTNRISVALF